MAYVITHPERGVLVGVCPCCRTWSSYPGCPVGWGAVAYDTEVEALSIAAERHDGDGCEATDVPGAGDGYASYEAMVTSGVLAIPEPAPEPEPAPDQPAELYGY